MGVGPSVMVTASRRLIMNQYNSSSTTTVPLRHKETYQKFTLLRKLCLLEVSPPATHVIDQQGSGPEVSQIKGETV